MNLDQYGRTVAACSADGADLGEWLVHNGLALDWPQFSKGRYDAAQRDAEHAGRGIRAVTLNRGSTGPVSAPTEIPQTAPTMRLRIRRRTLDVLVWTASHPHGSMALSASQLDERKV
jgi:hypothetical protein